MIRLVREANNNHIVTGVALAPLPCPQIQHVVKIDIRQQQRYHNALSNQI